MGQEQTTQLPDITGKKQGKWHPPEEYQWKKGESGNLAGRPPGSVSITARIKEKLLEVPDENLKKSYLDLLIEKILKKALVNGDAQIIKQIWSYVDGPPGSEENLEAIVINLLNKYEINIHNN
ncbi:MAG: DUF5681 domain-containing protein [Candidatus Staskawiczbacteria bacterium]|nr:DUF5681 domain-containing protein [Candidatus Staskawiczbacteria bacterium]